MFYQKNKHNYFLPPIHNNYTKSNYSIITADFETVIIKNKHYIYCYSISTNMTNICRIISYNIKENSSLFIKNFVKELILISYGKNYNKEAKIVYFHNLGTFDGILLLNILLENNIKIKNILIKESTIYYIQIQNLYFKDSYKILNNSLNKLSNTFLKEKKINYQLLFFFLKKNINLFLKTKFINILKFYSVKDTLQLRLILLQVITHFNLEFGINVYKTLTLSSLAFKVFRQNYLKKNKIEILSTSNKYDYLRKSYVGGITEIYHPFGRNLYYYDINSAYASIMIKQTFPTNFGKSFKGSDIKLKQFFGFLTVKVQVFEKIVPFLYKQVNKKLIFPNGIFVTTLFSEELKYALKRTKTTLLKIYYGISYDRSILFNNYVDNLYLKKVMAQKQKHEGLSVIYKLLLNNLYGRFGIKTTFLKTLILSKKEQKLEEILQQCIQIIHEYNTKYFKVICYQLLPLQKIQKYLKSIKNVSTKFNFLYTQYKTLSIKDKAQIYTSPQIASSIVSYGRILLDRYKRYILKKKGVIYYCDTDSIITDLYIKSSLLNSRSTLGALKMIFFIKKAYFIEPKSYLLKLPFNKKIIKFKGLPLDKKIKISENWFKTALYGVKGTIIFSSPVRKKMKNLELHMTTNNYNFYHLNAKRKKIYSIKGVWILTNPLLFLS